MSRSVRVFLGLAVLSAAPSAGAAPTLNSDGGQRFDFYVGLGETGHMADGTSDSSRSGPGRAGRQ